MAPIARPFESLEELHQTELDYFRRMIESGVVVAIPAAKHYCVSHDLDIPAWLTKASIELECTSLRRGERKQLGRTADPVARHRQDMRHYERWDTVVEIVEARRLLKIEIEKLRKLPKVPPHVLLLHEEKLRDLGSSLEDAFQTASNTLAMGKSFGGADSMNKSYRRIEREFRDPQTAVRYHLLDPKFIREI